jgi:hypothetical protein
MIDNLNNIHGNYLQKVAHRKGERDKHIKNLFIARH